LPFSFPGGDDSFPSIALCDDDNEDIQAYSTSDKSSQFAVVCVVLNLFPEWILEDAAGVIKFDMMFTLSLQVFSWIPITS